jgi:hypothetical protein
MPGFLSAHTSKGRLLTLLLDNLHLGHSGRAVNDVIPKHLQDDLVRLPQGVSLAALGMHHSTGLNLRDHIALGHGALLMARKTCLKNSNRGIGLLFLCPPTSLGILPLLLQLVQQGLGAVATIPHPLFPLLIVLLLLCEQVPMTEVRALDLLGLLHEGPQN